MTTTSLPASQADKNEARYYANFKQVAHITDDRTIVIDGVMNESYWPKPREAKYLGDLCIYGRQRNYKARERLRHDWGIDLTPAQEGQRARCTYLDSNNHLWDLYHTIFPRERGHRAANVDRHHTLHRICRGTVPKDEADAYRDRVQARIGTRPKTETESKTKTKTKPEPDYKLLLSDLEKILREFVKESAVIFGKAGLHDQEDGE